MRLVVTRPREDAEDLRAKLENLGHRVILSSLLEIVPIADIAIPDEPYQLIALTSANGARALSRHPALSKLDRLPAFTVGPQSAEAAQSTGFSDVHMAGGDAIGLAKHITRTRDPKRGSILYVSGRDSASDFAGKLEAQGFTVTRVIAYEAKAASKLAAEVHKGADGVLLFSPRTARIWRELVTREGLDAAARAMVHICISGNSASALPEAFPRRIAAKPTETAMLDIIAALSSG